MVFPFSFLHCHLTSSKLLSNFSSSFQPQRRHQFFHKALRTFCRLACSHNSCHALLETLAQSVFLFVCLFCFFFLGGAAPTYGCSQARSWIWAIAAGLCLSHSNTAWAASVTYTIAQMVNPLIEARDGTCDLTDTSWVHLHWATMGTPQSIFYTIEVY